MRLHSPNKIQQRATDPTYYAAHGQSQQNISMTQNLNSSKEMVAAAAAQNSKSGRSIITQNAHNRSMEQSQQNQMAIQKQIQQLQKQ